MTRILVRSLPEAEPNGEAVARAARERSEQEREAMHNTPASSANQRTLSA